MRRWYIQWWQAPGVCNLYQKGVFQSVKSILWYESSCVVFQHLAYEGQCSHCLPLRCFFAWFCLVCTVVQEIARYYFSSRQFQSRQWGSLELKQTTAHADGFENTWEVKMCLELQLWSWNAYMSFVMSLLTRSFDCPFWSFLPSPAAGFENNVNMAAPS